jgi:transposase
MDIRKRTFSKELKLHILKEVESGKGVMETARKYQIHPNLIGRWRNQFDIYKDEAFAGRGHAYTDAARISALEREVAKLQSENELLKKALSQRDHPHCKVESSGGRQR